MPRGLHSMLPTDHIDYIHREEKKLYKPDTGILVKESVVCVLTLS
jgi:hypothetical protein